MPSLRDIHLTLLALAFLFALAAIAWNGALFLQAKGGTYPLFVMVSLMFCALIAYRASRVWRDRGDGQ